MRGSGAWRRGRAGFRAAPATARTGAVRKELTEMPVVPAAIRRALLRAVRSIRTAWRNHLRRRQRVRDFAVLIAMDDLSLRDLGISRCEVRAAIRERKDLMPR